MVLVSQHLKPLVKLFWVIILLQHETLTNQSVLISSFLPFSHPSHITEHHQRRKRGSTGQLIVERMNAKFLLLLSLSAIWNEKDLR